MIQEIHDIVSVRILAESDWTKLIFPAILMVMYFLSSIFGEKKKEDQPKPRRPQPSSSPDPKPQTTSKKRLPSYARKHQQSQTDGRSDQTQPQTISRSTSTTPPQPVQRQPQRTPRPVSQPKPPVSQPRPQQVSRPTQRKPAGDARKSVQPKMTQTQRHVQAEQKLREQKAKERQRRTSQSSAKAKRAQYEQVFAPQVVSDVKTNKALNMLYKKTHRNNKLAQAILFTEFLNQPVGLRQNDSNSYGY